MMRIDARVKTHLPARVCGINGSGNAGNRVVIKELSLSSALVHGLSKCDEPLRIVLQLHGGQAPELQAEIVRVNNGLAALKLFCPNFPSMKLLWEEIRGELKPTGSCPYCGHVHTSRASFCGDCGLSLEFDIDSYLTDHFENTFSMRVKRRVAGLETTHLEKILKLIDKEVLRTKGQPHEDEFVGSSQAMLEVFSMIRKVAQSDVNVLILGESGTGKELTAQAIHERSPRRDKPFQAINSAAIPEGLLEAELFGYEKGSFTGAHATRRGKFEQADGGTIFLDEVGDLSPGLQAKLLRFLENRIVERLGAKGGRKVDVRIITATNCNLEQMVAEGRFRNDLYYRLDGFTIVLPPLRERGDDKIILANYILKRIATTENSTRKSFSAAALEAIRQYHWPGNVREMINKIRRGELMAQGSVIEPSDMKIVSFSIQEEQNALQMKISATQRLVVTKALNENNFVIARAAKALGISRPSLYALMKKYDIHRERSGSKTMN